MNAFLLPPLLQQQYQQQLARLPAEVQGRYQETELGPVWVLQAGAEDAPPLLALHGLQTPAPFMMPMLMQLSRHFRVICPDIPGQAGYSGPLSPIPMQQGYGFWVGKLMDALAIDRCPMVGMSFGGAVLLDTAVFSPERITAASLLVPAGFFRPLWRPVKKLLLPVLNFKLHSDRSHFDRIMDPLMADNWPELRAYYYAVFESGLPLMLPPPGPFHREQLCRFTAPVQLVVAEEDVYFAPDKLIRAAQAVLPGLKVQVRIDDLHIPTQANRSKIESEVLSFLKRQGSGLW